MTMAEDGVVRASLTPKQVIDNGLLWAINRTLLHPRGFALALDPDTGAMELWGNGDEPWTYEGIDENGKFAAFERLLTSVMPNG